MDQKSKKRDKADVNDDGPNYYVVRGHRLGSALVGLVHRRLDEGGLSYSKAGQVLGVKPRNVEPLLRATVAKGGG